MRRGGPWAGRRPTARLACSRASGRPRTGAARRASPCSARGLQGLRELTGGRDLDVAVPGARSLEGQQAGRRRCEAPAPDLCKPRPVYPGSSLSSWQRNLGHMFQWFGHQTIMVWVCLLIRRRTPAFTTGLPSGTQSDSPSGLRSGQERSCALPMAGISPTRPDFAQCDWSVT